MTPWPTDSEQLLMPTRRFKVLRMDDGWGTYDDLKDEWVDLASHWLWTDADVRRRQVEEFARLLGHQVALDG